MLAFVIDFRSETTVIHTMTAVNFAEQLGTLMEVSKEELENIRYGTLLHDLGKIMIPPEILESSRTLSGEEMKIMRSHVLGTEAILKDSIGEPVLQIAVRHHEKLDGSGYPRGLRDQEMTLPQKIVAVADILSALYGKRSYKEPFDKGKIKSIIQDEAESGKISKLVVQCLLEHYDQVIKKYEKEKDNIIGLYLKIKSEYQDICGEFERIV
jgi:HD-GYP domain-containing protein (c-di-GMP phosphodiesterase class II)